ncbi:MAG: molybdenum cofactor biosynthesis protein MoaE [Bacteroidetes bacterium]|nr:molybdenum cofactor biosynthesis protein MoaE [Bacteroidota bacterium]
MTTTTRDKSKKTFIEGPITPQFIADSIAKHSTKTEIGAHSIFMGQVRNDLIDGKEVKAIEYSAYKEMAEKEFHKIRESAFERFDLSCMHIYHSLGIVKTGEISLFIFVSSKHREECFKASRYITEEIKVHVPIFGKEIFEDDTYVWKENKITK